MGMIYEKYGTAGQIFINDLSYNLNESVNGNKDHKWFTKTRNNNKLRMYPCGTPAVTTFCFLFG